MILVLPTNASPLRLEVAHFLDGVHPSADVIGDRVPAQIKRSAQDATTAVGNYLRQAPDGQFKRYLVEHHLPNGRSTERATACFSLDGLADQTTLAGGSAGLAFALTHAASMLQGFLLTCGEGQRDALWPAVAATGRVSPEGSVFSIDGLLEKANWARSVLTPGGWLFYPTVNEPGANWPRDWPQTGIECKPVATVGEAVDALLNAALHGFFFPKIEALTAHLNDEVDRYRVAQQDVHRFSIAFEMLVSQQAVLEQLGLVVAELDTLWHEVETAPATSWNDVQGVRTRVTAALQQARDPSALLASVTKDLGHRRQAPHLDLMPQEARELLRAYHDLELIYHPDRQPPDEEWARVLDEFRVARKERDYATIMAYWVRFGPRFDLGESAPLEAFSRAADRLHKLQQITARFSGRAEQVRVNYDTLQPFFTDGHIRALRTDIEREVAETVAARDDLLAKLEDKVQGLTYGGNGVH